MPARIFSVGDLPAPFGPMNATRSPGSIENESRSTASTVWVSGRTRSRTRAAMPPRRGRRTRNDFDSWLSSTAATGVVGGMATRSVAPRSPGKAKRPPGGFRKGVIPDRSLRFRLLHLDVDVQVARVGDAALRNDDDEGRTRTGRHEC